jgi:CubicO group peptidase (beta-lactamase class C family)
MTVALVHDGELVWSGAYGVRDAATAEPMQPDDLLQVASVSKSVTAYAVMRLVQDGLLDLDAPIGDYLSRWQLPDSTHDAEGVTARRLLSHTAGLSTEGYPGLAPGDRLPTLEESLDGTTGTDPVALVEAPGASHRYSGGGYTLLQLAVEEITGQSFADLVAEGVFAPLGMADSTYDQAPLDGASPHGSDGGVIEGRRFVELAAAGLWSTAPDLARFLAAGILDTDPTTGLEADQVSELLAPAPATDGAFALGFFVDQNGNGPVVIGHAGANAGWRSKILAIPELDAAIVVLLNGDGGEAIHVELGCAWVAATAELPSIDAACP